MAQFLTTHKVASVLEDPTSQSLHGQSQDFLGFAPDAMGSALLLLLELESMHYWQLEAQSPLPT